MLDTDVQNGTAQKEQKKMNRLEHGIRDKNPCHGCTRDRKKPGCHDTCPDRKVWKDELDRVNAARKEYDLRHRW